METDNLSTPLFLELLKEQSNLLNKSCQQFQTEIRSIINDTNANRSTKNTINKLCDDYSASLNKICIQYLIKFEKNIPFNDPHSIQTNHSYSLKNRIPSFARKSSIKHYYADDNESSGAEFSTSSSSDAQYNSSQGLDHSGTVTTDTFCMLCNRDFHSINRLKEHLLQRHSDQRPFQCDQCDKAFKLKKTFHYHIRQEHNGYPVKCDQCNKKFKYKKQLSKHKCDEHIPSGIDIDDDEVEYMEYDVICKDKMELNRHRNTVHTMIDPNPFKCDICNKAYGSLDSLYKHKSSHSNRRFECEYCSKCFSKNGYRIRHIYRVHQKDPWFCDQCDQTFRIRKDLKKHIESDHKTVEKMDEEMESNTHNDMVMQYAFNNDKEQESNEIEEDMNVEQLLTLD